MRKELKPCPFCGGKPHFKPREYGIEKLTWVLCLKCGAHGGSDFDNEKAIAAWNKRSER